MTQAPKPRSSGGAVVVSGEREAVAGAVAREWEGLNIGVRALRLLCCCCPACRCCPFRRSLLQPVRVPQPLPLLPMVAVAGGGASAMAGAWTPWAAHPLVATSTGPSHGLVA